MENYLTTQELSERIKMTPGTIRNLVWRKELKENVHYVKPTPRKLLFVWSAIEKWLYGQTTNVERKQMGSDCLINI
ncbi:hypothetical protein [uncultured Desulfosarcina sp.]|uniref:hypothetical protein n=1 Tax=uncultured Desulfosarcina sp. TaxID=218289 RepID=UPI0029C71C84|nr:hypothetical protein [uncultured Desulfosarcina sp.]